MSSTKNATVTKDASRPALVPKLRFPEFEGEWEVRFGSELFSQISERNPGTDLPVLAITQEHGAIPRSMIDYHVSVTEGSLDTYKLVREGDFIISLRSFQGGIEYSQYQGVCSPAYVILRRSCQGIDDYYRQYLKTGRFISILTRNLEGLRDGKMISYKQFSELPLPVPTLPEQQRIASCLSSLDELIGAQTRKVDALKTHKKGLMQQLFPREGETQPRLRFPEFEGEWEWNIRPLGDCLDYRQPTPYLVASEEYDPSFQTPVLTAGKTFVLGYTNERNGVFESGLPVIIFDDFTTASKFVNFPFKAKSSAMKILLAKSDIDIKFMFELLQTIQFEVGAHERHWISTFALMFVQIPELSEQQRIASCLSSLDELITNENIKLETYKTHKKGLMQGLFPKVEELAS